MKIWVAQRISQFIRKFPRKKRVASPHKKSKKVKPKSHDLSEIPSGLKVLADSLPESIR